MKSKKLLIFWIFLLVLPTCKSRNKLSSQSRSVANASIDDNNDGYETLCKSNPEKCTAEALIKEKMGAIPCMKLWSSGGDNIYAYDQYSNQYHRKENWQSKTHPVSFHTLKDLTSTIYSSKTLNPLSAKDAVRLNDSLSEVLGPQKDTLGWLDMPYGYGNNREGNIFPKFYALKVENKLLGNREEWVIFHPQVPPSLTIPGFENAVKPMHQQVKDAAISMCIPIRTHVEGDSANFSKLSLIETLNEKDDLALDVERWDKLYNSMVTFVEAAPGTGQIATIYKGCYLKEKSCLRSVLIATADTASYFVMIPPGYQALGRTTYLTVTAVGAAANAVEAGLLVNESYQAAQSGNKLQSALLAGAAVMRFTAATGLTLDFI